MKKLVVEIITVLLIALWIYAGLNKLLDYGTFRFQLARSPFIQSQAGLLAWLLPIGEICIAIILVPKRTKMLGLYLSFFLMVLFTGYIYAMLHYSYYIPCSCGGVLSQLDWNSHLLFNIIFTALALLAILIQSKKSPEEKVLPALK